jgi:hypothetical protein
MPALVAESSELVNSVSFSDLGSVLGVTVNSNTANLHGMVLGFCRVPRIRLVDHSTPTAAMSYLHHEEAMFKKNESHNSEISNSF